MRTVDYRTTVDIPHSLPQSGGLPVQVGPGNLLLLMVSGGV
jgi:hypothetical protein